MADDDAKSDSKESKDGGLGGKLKIVGAVVISLAAGYFFFGRGGASAETAVTTTTIPLTEESEGAVAEVGTLTVNLADESPRFARVGVALVLVEGTDPLLVEGKFPLVLDAVLSEVGQFTAAELLSENGFDELRSRIGVHAVEIYNDEDEGERVVKRIVLTELLVQ